MAKKKVKAPKVKAQKVKAPKVKAIKSATTETSSIPTYEEAKKIGNSAILEFFMNGVTTKEASWWDLQGLGMNMHEVGQIEAKIGKYKLHRQSIASNFIITIE